MIKNKWRNALVWLIRVGPPLITLFIGIFYVFSVLINFNKDTTPITNAAFAIISVFAGLSFGMASVVSDDKVKDRFVYSGERFFHAAILLILASILKYSALSIRELSFLESRQTISIILTFPLSALVQFCFMYALMEAHTGINVANKELWQRLTIYDDWDKMV